MPYLAMIDRFRSFLRKRRATLVLCGYSFGDEHLQDVLLQELEGNPTAAAFALMHGTLDRHPSAIALAERRPNLTVIAEDAAVVGTQLGAWTMADEGKASVVSLGDFRVLGGDARRDERRAAGRVDSCDLTPRCSGSLTTYAERR